MERYIKEYTRWCSKQLPAMLKAELSTIENNKEEMYNRFCRDMHFGTSGMRGKMGAGTNWMNTITVRRTTVAVARWLEEFPCRPKRPVAVIGYDTRLNSELYAQTAAETLLSHGVDVWISSQNMPVPALSFAVRYLKADCGIMITASHNPKEYNGYKVYDDRGCQIDEATARRIEEHMAAVDCFEQEIATEKGKLHRFGEEMKEQYLQALYNNLAFWGEEATRRQAMAELKICYTPLNGVGYPYVTEILKRIGIKQRTDVLSQTEADGNFPTCPSPNPEYLETFKEALKTCEQEEKAGGEPFDLILATDPDSDRMGVMVREGRQYTLLSGNQVGELLFDYLCRVRLPEEDAESSKDKVVLKSYVSSPMIGRIAADKGIELKEVFTGFKNIAAYMEKLQEQGRSDAFFFGFEESLGYLYGDYTRDKDGILAAATICLLAAEQKKQGKTLTDRLEEIYRKYGYLCAGGFSRVYESEKDRPKMDRIMNILFQNGLKKKMPGIGKETCYRTQKMYCADFEGGHRLIIRPSGTELKLKTYIFSAGETAEEARLTGKRMEEGIRDFIRKVEIYE